MLWEKAPNKVPVVITIQGGSGRLENLGTLQVDMDCPVYIARNILMQALGSDKTALAPIFFIMAAKD